MSIVQPTSRRSARVEYAWISRSLRRCPPHLLGLVGVGPPLLDGGRQGTPTARGPNMVQGESLSQTSTVDGAAQFAAAG